MEALFVTGDLGNAKENNTSQYRIHGPAKYLQRAGHVIALAGMSGLSREHDSLEKKVEIDHLDYSLVREVVLFERNITPERVVKMRAMGAKRIIVTFDDHYGLLPPYMSSYSFWEQHYGGFLKALGMVDLVIVPSIRLVDRFATYCRSIKYVPNFIDAERWPVPNPERGNVLGWGGSLGHIESWRNANLQFAIRSFLKDHPDWEFHTYGPIGADWALRHTQIKAHDWVPFDEWPNRVNQFALGLAPLQGAYDQCRSNLKLLEYQQLGIPWLASHDTPYTRPKSLKGGRLVKRAWLDELYELAANPELRQQLGQIGRAESSEHRMDRNVHIYEEILWG